ncbi:4-alpha-glucanotransferase [Faecalibaculum rodentium]|nr:4-alpha-glucanotransferase [Faecalibaculum rodentium]
MMWHGNQTRRERTRLNRIYRQLQLRGSTPAQKLCRYCLESDAAWAILPLQDLWSLDTDARINAPGTCGNPNWQWRMTDFARLEAMLPRLHHLLKVTHRLREQKR